MLRFVVVVFVALLTLFPAVAGHMTLIGAGKPSGGGGATNFILLIDNTSKLLQTDNTNKVCLAGGC